MSNVQVISHFSTTGEKERRQTFNELARTMARGILRKHDPTPKKHGTAKSVKK